MPSAAADDVFRSEGRRVLVAGVGNILRGDDGFGPAVIEALLAGDALPARVKVVEVGIGGINLVHELMDGYDLLVIVDAVEGGGAPGALYTIDPEVPDAAALSGMERRELTVDMHQAIPAAALTIARAAGVLPPVVRIVGCEPAETEEFVMELSPAVRRTLPAAVEAVRKLALSREDETWERSDG